ncbi:MAG: murein biosynthesis integral membrane protein MurJ [bacterium]
MQTSDVKGKHEPILRSVAVVGSMTGLSRILGLVREWLMAYFFGTSLQKSAFDVAFRIPNLFRRLFGEGALSAAFIPVYTETLKNEGHEVANRLASRIAGFLVAVLGSITALGILLSLGLQQLLAYNARAEAVYPLLRITLFYAPLICLVALGIGILNTLRQFALPALVPLFLNLVWILALVGICPFVSANLDVRIGVVAWSTMAAGFVQVGVLLPALRKQGVPLRIAFDWLSDARVRQVLRLSLPMAVGMGAVQINLFVDGLLALYAGTWGPSAMEYAERVTYLPMGLVGTAFATVLLPTFAKHAADADHEMLRMTLERALRTIAVIMVPMSVGLAVLALPIINLLYTCHSGKFDAQSALYSSRALMGYAPGLLAFSFYKALTPAFYALKDMRTPLRCSVVCVGLNFCLNLIFVFTWADGWKHVGLAIATVISSVVNCGMLAWVLRKKFGAPRFGTVIPIIVRLIAISLVMGVAAYYAEREISRVLTDAGWLYKLVELTAVLGAMAAGALVYGVLLLLFCRSALNELIGDVRSRRQCGRS